jgi:cytochrome P450
VTITEPLDFDPYSPEFSADPFSTFRRMRDEAPVYYNEAYNFYALSRHADVAAAFKDTTTFSSTRGITLDQVSKGELVMPMLIMMDPPDHRRHRSLLNRVFTPRAIQALEPMVRERVQHFLGQVDPAGFDVIRDFSALFPVEVIAAMLGVPAEDRQQIRIWMDRQLHRDHGSIEVTEDGMAAAIENGTYYYELAVQRRAEPQDDMISSLVQAEWTDENGATVRLNDVDVAAFASLLGGAGAETVTKLIGNAVVTFADHPEQWQQLLDDRSKVVPAVEELLRHQSPAYQVRYCTKEVTLHGVTIPEGAAVFLLPAAGNRDERAFDEPDRFDINRVMRSPNLGFGYGIHSCLGAALARLESRVALEALLDFMPRYEIDRPGLQRVSMTNVIGWSHVPVRVL